MRAILNTVFGGVDTLRLAEVPIPVPKADEVLISLRAASVNSWDWDWLRGRPKVFRFLFGFTTPRINILGADVAGVVESVGNHVVGFKPGDRVFGDLCAGNWGGFAEYVCASAKALSIIPGTITFEQAAAIPQAGVLALQGLRLGGILLNLKVLINGGGGGVGSFAIQLAKLEGAHVTAVDAKSKHAAMLAWGADKVIDYTTDDFTKQSIHYDLILDVQATHTMVEYARVLTPTGRYVQVGGQVRSIFQAMTLGPLLSRKGGKRLGILAHKPNPSDQLYLAQLVSENQLMAHIGATYSLEQVPQALAHLGEGRSIGKVVIKI